MLSKLFCTEFFKMSIIPVTLNAAPVSDTSLFFFFGKSVPGNWSQWIHVTVYTQRPQRPSAREDNPSRVSQELSPREAQLLRRVIWSCPQPCLLTATTHRAVAGCACVGHESSPVSEQLEKAGRAGKPRVPPFCHLRPHPFGHILPSHTSDIPVFCSPLASCDLQMRCLMF